jgi:phosphatidylinositol alpha-mannosyltransferase
METQVPKRSLKIAMTSYYLPPMDRIGAGYMSHYLANFYQKAGHQVTMFSPPREKADDALYDLRPVPVGKSNRSFRFAWNLRDIDYSSFDLLHTAGDACWLAGKKRPHHIATFHGSCLAEAIYSPDFRSRLRMFLLGLAELATCAVADRKVCVSYNTRRYMPFVREVIWNGVDRAAFTPGAEKSAAPSILFVGTMGYRKRGAELLKIFQEQIRPVFPEAELWIVREQTPVVADGVRWFGPVSQEKLIELYQKAWVFCLPSSYEGFGVPYIEAMSCGTPVVATPNVGALEVLEHGKFGKIADLPALGEAIITLLQDGPERLRLRDNGLERANEFDWPGIVEAYLSSVPACRSGKRVAEDAATRQHRRASYTSTR